MSRRQRQTVAEPDQRATVPDALRRSIKCNLSEFVGIPDPSEEWLFGQADISQSAHHKLIQSDAVHVVSREGERRKWRTDPDVYAEIQQIAAEQPLLDCGHKAFRTIDTDSDRPYSCLRDDCDSRYTRATIKGVMR